MAYSDSPSCFLWCLGTSEYFEFRCQKSDTHDSCHHFGSKDCKSTPPVHSKTTILTGSRRQTTCQVHQPPTHNRIHGTIVLYIYLQYMRLKKNENERMSPKKGNTSSNWFSGDMLVFRGVIFMVNASKYISPMDPMRFQSMLETSPWWPGEIHPVLDNRNWNLKLCHEFGSLTLEC